MAFDTSLLTDYSWADIAKAAKVAMMSAAVGGANYSINGRQLGRISIKDARLLYDTAQEMISAESTDSPAGLALVRYGERV